jgi:NACalpha-BTF3-like transcription factor
MELHSDLQLASDLPIQNESTEKGGHQEAKTQKVNHERKRDSHGRRDDISFGKQQIEIVMHQTPEAPNKIRK